MLNFTQKGCAAPPFALDAGKASSTGPYSGRRSFRRTYDKKKAQYCQDAL
jgi:hypothetical protein